MLVDNACALVQGPAGGFLATAGFVWAARANAVVALTIFPIAYFYLREQRVPQQGTAIALQNAGQQLKRIVRAKNLWLTLLFIGLYYFSPGFGTPLLYRQTDTLHFSKQAIGNLGVYLNAGTTAVLVLLPFLPAALMMSKDNAGKQ